MNINKTTTQITYMTGVNADKTFPVKELRVPEGYLLGTSQREFAIGDTLFGGAIASIDFYTGFAGCPARYYVTRQDGDTTILMA